MKTETKENLIASHEAGYKLYTEHAKFWVERNMPTKAKYFAGLAAEYKEKAEALRKGENV